MTYSARVRFVQAGAIATAALLSSGLAAPVQASWNQQQGAQPSQSTSSDRRICVRMDMPNTRLQRRVCRTEAEWERLGGVPGND